MSVRSLTTLAVERDTEAPASAKGFTDVLISAIPSEVLGLYTFVVTAIVGTITAGDDKQLGLRWVVFVAGALATVVHLLVGYVQVRHATRRRRFPGPEVTAAVVAFSAWGLIMPGSPLTATLSADGARIWTAIITAVGVFVLFLLRGSLTKPASRAQ
jgi:hypothetical protein